MLLQSSAPTAVELTFIEWTNDAARSPPNERERRDLRATSQKGPGYHDGASTNLDSFQQDRTVPYKGARFDYRASNQRPLANKYMLTNFDGLTTRAHVQTGKVLNRRVSPHPDGPEVTPKHRPVPNARVFSEFNMADQHGPIRQENPMTDLGDEPVERPDDC